MWHFINLTNGIELLQSLVSSCGVTPASVGFCRIQSSHCEACDFAAVLRELDHGLLLRLALGDAALIHDCGSRDLAWPTVPGEAVGGEGEQLSKGASGLLYEGLAGDGPTGAASVPRALWWGVEWARFALRESWQLNTKNGGSAEGEQGNAGDDATPKSAWSLRGYNIEPMFRSKFRQLPKSLRKRLKYYRGFVEASGTEVNRCCSSLKRRRLLCAWRGSTERSIACTAILPAR